MNKATFSVTISQDEDGYFIAECPEVPGCVSQGRTKVEAMENVRNAIRECLEVRREQGLPLTIRVEQVEVTV
ncbi:MAG: type II toxin-antitoxin system HicB family antitoxin [Acidobacteriota bacterium]|nr:type II toxin-antitoxin system HicB family antitoxin [Acidobacteriota bacterium]